MSDVIKVVATITILEICQEVTHHDSKLTKWNSITNVQKKSSLKYCLDRRCPTNSFS